jgi:DNA-binding transcriptional LysR family regulator
MSYQLEFRHFKYFLAVANELHFRKAADQLYISQPGLSRQIKQMEQELDVKLFERSSRKVELTKAGQYLKTELETHFNKLGAVLAQAKLLNDGIDGNLKMGYIGSAMHKIIPDYLLKFRETNSNTLINLTEMDINSQIQALLHQEIDVGFVRLERVPEGLQMQSVFEETFSLVLPKSHPIDTANFENLSQFKDEPFILFDASYSSSYYETVMQIFDDSGFHPAILHSTVNASSIYRLVENNFGISIVPTSLQSGYNLDVKFIELTEISQRTTLKIVWNTSNTNPILKSFLSVVNQFVELDLAL